MIRPFFFITTLSFLLIASINCFAKENLKIYGKVSNIGSGVKVYIQSESNPLHYRDSTISQKNEFLFNLNIKEKDMYLLYFDIEGNSIAFPVFLQPDDKPLYLDLSLDERYQQFQKIELKGSCLAEEQTDFIAGMFNLANWETFLDVQMRIAKDTTVHNELKKQREGMHKIREYYYDNWIQNHINSPYTPAVIFACLRDELPLNKLDIYDNHLTDSAKQNNLVAQKLSAYIKRRKLGTPLKVGDTMKDFVLQDTSGVSHSFFSISKNSFTLIDVWASWCGPCRASSPVLKTLLEQYKNHNFKVLGISGDKDKEAWKAAIAKDKLNWIHLSDLKGGEEGSFTNLHDITSYPSYILVSPEGKIVFYTNDINDAADKLGTIFN